jgi:hypothetical protein
VRKKVPQNIHTPNGLYRSIEFLNWPACTKPGFPTITPIPTTCHPRVPSLRLHCRRLLTAGTHTHTHTHSHTYSHTFTPHTHYSPLTTHHSLTQRLRIPTGQHHFETLRKNEFRGTLPPTHVLGSWTRKSPAYSQLTGNQAKRAPFFPHAT